MFSLIYLIYEKLGEINSGMLPNINFMEADWGWVGDYTQFVILFDIEFESDEFGIVE